MPHHFETAYAMRFAFRADGFEVRWYSLFVVAAFAVGWLVSRRIIARSAFGRELTRITPAQVDELYILLIVFAVIGARLGQVVFYEPTTIVDLPRRIFALRESGSSSHGAAAGLLVAAALWARRVRLPLRAALDLVIAPAPVYPFFVRLGNFLNSELYGTPTDAPWGVVFYGAGPASRHPVQIYELILEGICGAILVALVIRRFGFLRPGLIAGAYLVYYSLVRAFCEMFKPSEPGAFDVGGLPTATVLTAPMLALGLWLVFAALKHARADNAA